MTDLDAQKQMNQLAEQYTPEEIFDMGYTPADFDFRKGFFNSIDDFFTGRKTRDYERWLNAYDQWSQAKQYEREIAAQKFMNENSYQWLVKGLEEAGLNPYFVLSQGALSPTTYNTTTSAYKAANVENKKNNGLSKLMWAIAAVVKIMAAL